MDAYDEWKDSDEESGGEEEEATKVVFKPSYVLIAIDTHESMFEYEDPANCAFKNCIQACYKILDSLVLADTSSVKGQLCIVLAENDTAKANFVEFTDVVPDTVKMLKMLEQQTNQDLKSKYNRKGDFDLGDFFLFCKNKLLQINAEFYKRTIIYVTNQENPGPMDAKKKFKIMHEASKFESLQMEYRMLTFNTCFHIDDFYSEVLSVAKCDVIAVNKCENALDLANKLSLFILSKFRRYKYKLYPFQGDTENYIEVLTSKNFQRPSMSKNKYVTRDTQKEVKKSMRQQAGTGNYECTYAKGEEPIILNEAEKEALTETDLPIGYTLLCVTENMGRHGWILEPNVLVEKYHKETEPMFEALWHYCRDEIKHLICVRKFRKGGDIRLVEMIPKCVNQTRMFLTIALPFGTEVHYPELTKRENEVDEECSTAIKAMVEALTFSFDPVDFRDPVAANRKAYIKSQLLDEPIEAIVDGFPSDEYLDQLLKNEAPKLRELQLIDLPQPSARPRTQPVAIKPGRKKIKTEKK